MPYDGVGTSSMREKLLVCAQQGYLVVEATWPGWRERVKEEDIKMSTLSCCMIGLLGGDHDFSKTLQRHDRGIAWANAHGFAVCSGDGMPGKEQYEILTQIWRGFYRGEHLPLLPADLTPYRLQAAAPVTMDRVLVPA